MSRYAYDKRSVDEGMHTAVTLTTALYDEDYAAVERIFEEVDAATIPVLMALVHMIEILMEGHPVPAELLLTRFHSSLPPLASAGETE